MTVVTTGASGFWTMMTRRPLVNMARVTVGSLVEVVASSEAAKALVATAMRVRLAAMARCDLRKAKRYAENVRDGFIIQGVTLGDSD